MVDDNMRNSNRKVFIVTTPNGEKIQVSNLKAFCIKHGLSDGSMVATAQGRRKHYKGFKVNYL
jgi:hypothetical protein